MLFDRFRPNRSHAHVRAENLVRSADRFPWPRLTSRRPKRSTASPTQPCATPKPGRYCSRAFRHSPRCYVSFITHAMLERSSSARSRTEARRRPDLERVRVDRRRTFPGAHTIRLGGIRTEPEAIAGKCTAVGAIVVGVRHAKAPPCYKDDCLRRCGRRMTVRYHSSVTGVYVQTTSANAEASRTPNQSVSRFLACK